jgi:TrmH family RNA methyltransferase
MSLTMEALQHKNEYVEKVILSEKAIRNEQLDRLLELCGKYGIPVFYDEKTIESLSAKENCYCIGVFRKFNTPIKKEEHVVLYGFSDFGELGTVLRSAVSFDFRDIVLVDTDLDYFDPRCVRASMGSLFHCRIAEYDSLEAYRKKYPEHNIYPFVSRGSGKLQDLFPEQPFSILISQESNSLDGLFEEDYSVEQSDDAPISLSIRSSIILQEMYQRKRRR